jgi:hypothetical protein
MADKPPLSANVFVVVSRYTNAVHMAATIFGGFCFMLVFSYGREIARAKKLRPE